MTQLPDPIFPSRRRRSTVLITALLLALVILLPRVLLLDSSVNPDEGKWLARSANFYVALTQGDFQKTFQSSEPGVSIMWAGSAAFWWHDYALPTDTGRDLEWNEEEIESFLRDHDPLELLITARLLLVAINSAVLMLAFVVAYQLFGSSDWEWPSRPVAQSPSGAQETGNRIGWRLGVALGGFLLIALDPFHIALSRMFDLDGLLASLMLLCVLTFLCSLPLAEASPFADSQSEERQGQQGRQQQYIYLVLSGMMAGLAWLTKSSAFFLIPFIALCTLTHVSGRLDTQLWRAIKVFLAWSLVGVVTYMLFWPAMWVNPIGTIELIVEKTLLSAIAESHDPIYFKGTISKLDFGFFFYPTTYLWRTTPVVLLGLLLALLTFLTKRAPLDKAKTRRLTLILALFALLFMLFIGLWTDKSDRELIPIYLLLDMVSALGWIAAAHAGAAYLPAQIGRTFAWGLLAVGLIVQAYGIKSVFPDLMSYYNPLVGGGSQASQTMMIGWGEKLDEAARYLNNQPNAERLRVASWFHKGSFSYFFKGQSKAQSFQGIKALSEWFKTDYVVLYIQQQQRQLPSVEFLEHFTHQTPEKVIQWGGIDYAKIYDIRHLLPPAFLVQRGQPRFTDWGGAIRLLDYELRSYAKQGDSFQIYFYLENLAALEKNLSVLVRLVDQDGNELLRDEGWPFGSPTSSWKLHEIWRDGHNFTIPANVPTGYYRIMLSFYEPETLSPLPAINTLTSEPIGDELLVDYLYIGNLPTPPTNTVPIELGPDIRLLGARIDGLGEEAIILPSIANQTVDVLLFWQTEAPITPELTVFVHLVTADGQLVTQVDQPPPVPTDLWRIGDIIVDDVTLTVPPDTASGSYELRVGMYDPTTGQRLPVSENGHLIGDYMSIASFDIK